MKTRSFVPEIALCLVSAFSPVFCQTSPSKEQVSDAPMYLRFFKQVTLFKNSTGPVPVTSENAALILPWAKSVLKMTDAEFQNLITIAEECLAKTTPIDQEIIKPTFESRLEAIRTGAVPADLHYHIQQLEDYRARLVLDCVQQVKDTPGPVRFEEVDRLIHSNKDRPFFLGSIPANLIPSAVSPR